MLSFIEHCACSFCCYCRSALAVRPCSQARLGDPNLLRHGMDAEAINNESEILHCRQIKKRLPAKCSLVTSEIKPSRRNKKEQHFSKYIQLA